MFIHNKNEKFFRVKRNAVIWSESTFRTDFFSDALRNVYTTLTPAIVYKHFPSFLMFVALKIVVPHTLLKMYPPEVENAGLRITHFDYPSVLCGFGLYITVQEEVDLFALLCSVSLQIP